MLAELGTALIQPWKVVMSVEGTAASSSSSSRRRATAVEVLVLLVIFTHPQCIEL